MSSGLNLMGINLQTRPKINKHRAENIAKKGWDISSTHFPDEFLKNQECLFKQSMNQKSNNLDLPKERNTENLSKIFLGRVCHTIKRKSVSEMPKVTNEFLPSDKELVVGPIFSFNDNITSHKRFKKALLRREADIATSLQIKKASLQQVPQQHIGDNLSAFKNVFDMKSKNHTNTKENKLLHGFFNHMSLVTGDNFKKDSLIVPSKYDFLTKNDILYHNQENNDKSQSKLNLKQDVEKNGLHCSDNNFSGSMRAPFKISNHKKVPCEGNSSYGTNWVQSLNWSAEEDSYQCEKKRIPKITNGGYAAHVLKLQRKELSEKNIYDHKIGTSKTIDSLQMVISSIFYLDELVFTKCFMFSEGETSSEFEIKEITRNQSHEDSSIYYVIFQKQLFCKQQLKLGTLFILLKPWHCLQVNSLKYTVIFCTHFKCTMNDNQSNENCQILLSCESRECVSTTKKNLNATISKEEDIFYLKWKKNIKITGRIQRVWKTCSLNECHSNISGIQNNYWLSILFQSEQKTFYLLLIPSHFEGISNCPESFKFREGRCYVFNNLRMAQRLQSRRYFKLFRYLQNLLKLNSDIKLNQEFIYQLAVDDMSELSCKEIFTSPEWPAYLHSCLKPLSSLQKNYSCFERFSCVAKVLFQYKNFLYISDKSLFFSDSMQYVRVVLTKEESYVTSSEITIKEAIIHEGYLILDQYSQICLLQENQYEFSTIASKDLNIPLHINSKAADTVSVSGVIININENEACSWLQCNFCLSENLVQDTEDIIYCEDCSLVVENPLLHLKMCVTIHNKEQPNFLMLIQLSSNTIKKILCLDDNSVHPQCNVSDVLGTESGPFFCFIRGVEIIADKKVFYLNEI